MSEEIAFVVRFQSPAHAAVVKPILHAAFVELAEEINAGVHTCEYSKCGILFYRDIKPGKQPKHWYCCDRHRLAGTKALQRSKGRKEL